MTVHLRSLALETRLCPFPDIGVHSWPDELLCDEPLSCSNAWVCGGMQRVEYSTAEGGRNERAVVTNEGGKRGQLWNCDEPERR